MIKGSPQKGETSDSVWKYINIQCPVCKTFRRVEIPVRIINQAKQLTSVSIPKYRVCDHKFIALVDKNFTVRGYQKIDFEIFSEPKPKFRAQDIDVFGIIMNIKPEMLIYTIHACLFKYNVLLLLDKEIIHLDKVLKDFLNFIFRNSFETNISVKSKEDFKKSKNIYNDHIILKEKKIIGNAKKNINIEKLKYESYMVINFYKESDSNSSLTTLRDNIRQIFSLSQKIIEFNKRREEQLLKQKDIINFLENTHFLKMKKPYFNFLIKIVEKYFNTSIRFVQDEIADHIEKMW